MREPGVELCGELGQFFNQRLWARRMKTTSELKEPSRPTVKRLFAMSGNRCAYRKCTTTIIEADSGTVVGQVCHIKGEKKGSARYDDGQSAQERHGFDNLILLCGPHHKVIDDDEETYTVDRIKAIKKQHEGTATQVSEPNDEAADRLIATTRISISHGSIISAPNQSGGQTAHSITNIHLESTVAEEDKVRTELRNRNLDDCQHPNFATTRYSQRLGIMGKNAASVPPLLKGLFFALLPHRIVTREREGEFIAWMDSNKRRYDPFQHCPFLPSPICSRIGKACVWHDGDKQRFSATAECYTQYLAAEPNGYFEYGFFPGGWLDDDLRRVYYARMIAGFVAWLRFLKELCSRFGLDESTVSVGFALRGIMGRELACITKSVMPHFQKITPPNQDGFRFFRPATFAAEWTVDEVARDLADDILHLWQYSVPSGFGTPEFKGAEYQGEFFRGNFRCW